MDDIKVSLVQSHITWHSPEENFKSVSEHINAISDSDLIILPEMWSSGFTMKAHQFYRHTTEALELMKNWSLTKSAIIIGSLITKVDDDYFNRAYVVAKGEVIDTYDKAHLFAFSGEDRFYKSGQKSCVFAFKNWKVCLNICYDLRFPVWSRNTTDYDVLIYCANWPDKRIEAWDTLLRARAIENQSYVIGVNCFGVDAWKNTYSGHSAIIAYDGKTDQVLKGNCGVLESKLSKTKLMEFRDKFPFLRDRDEFQLK